MTEAPLLAAEGITVHLGGTPILRGVHLEVFPGEVVGVFGPSGAGKSTLFRALAGEERLTAGKVSLDGADVSSLPLWQRARRGLGYLPQTPSVLWDLTVAENLDVFVRLAPRGAIPLENPATILAEVGLEGRTHVRASALSGGERRRLELARTLIGRPRLLLCDEPFAAIDPLGANRIADRLRALAAAGAGVIVADHHVTEALGLCTRAALLLGGEIALIAAPAEFSRNPLVLKHYAVGMPTDCPKRNPPSAAG